MYHIVEGRIQEALGEFIQRRYGVDAPVGTERPPRIEMGQVASPVCFELAKRLKRAPGQRHDPLSLICSCRVARSAHFLSAGSEVQIRTLPGLPRNH